MPRGVPLTFEQVSKAAEVYRTSLSYTEAAKAIGADTSAVRKALLRRKEPERAFLHAHAVQQGVRRARKGITQSLDLVEKLIGNESSDGPGMEPRDIAALINAQSRSTEVLLSMEQREERRLQCNLTRQKTRAEINLLQAKTRGDVTDTTIVLSPGDEEFDRLMMEKWGALRQTTKQLPSEISDGGGPQEGVAEKPVP